LVDNSGESVAVAENQVQHIRNTET
jgi:hypothetical protein